MFRLSSFVDQGQLRNCIEESTNAPAELRRVEPLTPTEHGSKLSSKVFTSARPSRLRFGQSSRALHEVIGFAQYPARENPIKPIAFRAVPEGFGTIGLLTYKAASTNVLTRVALHRLPSNLRPAALSTG